MSTTSHTAGPWKANFESFCPEWAIITTAGGSIVANVNADHRQEANARLISAAPDLLEALRELCADKYLSDPINADRMKNARAAIAKAEGVK
jgi:Iap family predicted aminopeptidase